MRTTTFKDWFLEILLLLIFCGAVTGTDYVSAHKDPILTMWIVAAGWGISGFIRYIYHFNKVPPQ